MSNKTSAIQGLEDSLETLNYLENVANRFTYEEWCGLVESIEKSIHDAVDCLHDDIPRILSIDEFKAMAELPKSERVPVWEEWKSDHGNGRWVMPNEGYGGFGSSWRVWTAKPSKEILEATPW